jgi:hypothetical protein
MSLSVSFCVTAADIRHSSHTDDAGHPVMDTEKAASIVMYVAICRKFPRGPERDHWHAWLARLQGMPHLRLARVLPRKSS